MLLVALLSNLSTLLQIHGHSCSHKVLLPVMVRVRAASMFMNAKEQTLYQKLRITSETFLPSHTAHSPMYSSLCWLVTGLPLTPVSLRMNPLIYALLTNNASPSNCPPHIVLIPVKFRGTACMNLLCHC